MLSDHASGTVLHGVQFTQAARMAAVDDKAVTVCH
jgi:hypothetical protein